MTKKRFVLNCVVALSMTAALLVMTGQIGCKTNTATPAAPADPPQVTVLKYAQLATASGDTAAHVLVALCTSTPPVINIGTCRTVKADLLTIKSAVDRIVVEANKVPDTESWAKARVNIAPILANVTLGATVSDPSLQADITALESLIKQIAGVQ